MYENLCRHIGLLLESSLGVPLSEVTKFVPIPCALSAVVQQLVEMFPVISISTNDRMALVNCHELVMSGDGFERLLATVGSNFFSVHKRDSKKTTTSSSTTCAEFNPMGRPTLVSKFPTIVSVATSFIKANGYSVHERRREEVGKVGVSLQEIREHLLSTVPGLRSYGISLSSVARLM